MILFVFTLTAGRIDPNQTSFQNICSNLVRPGGYSIHPLLETVNRTVKIFLLTNILKCHRVHISQWLHRHRSLTVLHYRRTSA